MSSLKQLITVGTVAIQDGAAAEAMFSQVTGMLCLPDGRVLVADRRNHSIRMLSAESHAGGMHVSTVAGNGEAGHRDGAAAQARFYHPDGFALLPDGRVLVADSQRIRLLSADLQDVSTLEIDGMDGISCFEPLPDGRVLVGGNGIHVLEGFPSAKWLRRRTLLLGLRAAQPPRHKRLARPLCVLQRLAQLPTELWPSLFQYM